MEFKGTKGPWRVRKNHGHAPDRCDLTICGDIFCLADINGPNYAHCEANARAIAAVPDMIAALQECREILSDMARPADVSLAPVAIASAWARCVEAEAKARAALSRALTPEEEK